MNYETWLRYYVTAWLDLAEAVICIVCCGFYRPNFTMKWLVYRAGVPQD